MITSPLSLNIPLLMLLFPLGEQNMGDLLPNAAPPTQVDEEDGP